MRQQSHRTSDNHHQDEASAPAPTPTPLRTVKQVAPEIIAPAGVVIALDAVQRISSADHTSLSNEWKNEPSGRSKFYQGDLVEETIPAGNKGAGCQAIRGTVVEHHYMVVDYDSDAVMTARFADALELEAIASYRGDGALRLWIGEVMVEWKANEQRDSRQAVKIEMMPLAEFMGEHQDIPNVLVHRRMEAAEKLTRHLAAKGIVVDQLIDNQAEDPYARERVQVASINHEGAVADKALADLARSLVGELDAASIRALPAGIRALVEQIAARVSDEVHRDCVADVAAFAQEPSQD